MAGVLREVWTGEVLKYLTMADQDSFLEGIPDYSQYVATINEEVQAINLVAMDVLPEVLLNNAAYPLPVQTIGEDPVTLNLDKWQTAQTPVTDDELFALSYKKMQVMRDRHGLAIQIAKVKRAIHNLAPSGNTAKMPVLVTTGPDDGTGRKRLIWENVQTFKTSLDNMEVPEEGRRLTLSKDHENDLTLIDQKFAEQYYNRKDGKVYNQLGFEFHRTTASPYYNPATRNKIALNAVPAATDRKASVFFSLYRCAKATGWTKMYFSKAENDTATQRNMMNFRHHNLVLPTRNEARGAIVSGNV